MKNADIILDVNVAKRGQSHRGLFEWGYWGNQTSQSNRSKKTTSCTSYLEMGNGNQVADPQNPKKHPSSDGDAIT